MSSGRGWAFERGVLWAMDLTGEMTSPVLPRITTTFGEVHNGSLESLAKAMDLRDPKPIRQRLRSGRRCFAGWVEDQIAVYGWVSERPECIGELEREIQIQAGEAYIWDCVTLPTYRRQRLYSALLSHIVVALRSEGVRRVWIGSSLPNPPSIRGFVNAGFQPVIALTYVRLLNLSCSWLVGYPTASAQRITAARQALATGYGFAWGAIEVGRLRPTPLSGCAQVEA
jgi:GNAT superfamily N-acetyltransferase